MKYTLSPEHSFLVDADRDTQIYSSPFGVIYISSESRKVIAFNLKTQTKKELSKREAISLVYWKERKILFLFFQTKEIKYLLLDDEEKIFSSKCNLKTLVLSEENSELVNQYLCYWCVGSNERECFVRSSGFTLIFSFDSTNESENIKVKITFLYLSPTSSMDWEIDEIVKDDEDVYQISHKGHKHYVPAIGTIYYIDENTLLHSEEYLTFITLSKKESAIDPNTLSSTDESESYFKLDRCPHALVDFNFSKKCIISIESSKIFSKDPPFAEIGSFEECQVGSEYYPEILDDGNFLCYYDPDRVFVLSS